MSYSKYSAKDVERRGEELYEQQLRHLLEPLNKGKVVVIDIETGEYEVDENDLEATKRALAKRPDAILYGVRIGCPAAYTLGSHFTAAVR